jgi:hypothetical protein
LSLALARRLQKATDRELSSSCHDCNFLLPKVLAMTLLKNAGHAAKNKILVLNLIARPGD